MNIHNHKPRYSVIIPVYNRPNELAELLESLCMQQHQDFEVIVVDDGSSERADEVVDKFRDRLEINYYYKQNAGPGPARNYGFERAKGDYFIIFDSDCELPSHYFDALGNALFENNLDVWGGPDKARAGYSYLQKSINYAMTSLLTTGGIRGAKGKQAKFQPRSFNMGMSREAYKKSGGFKLNRQSEDIELSIRLRRLGFRIGLIEEAYVYHKRRSSLLDFFWQVYRFGKGRSSLIRMYPDATSIVHFFPLLFLLGLTVALVAPNPLQLVLGLVYVVYGLLIFLDASLQNKNPIIGVLSFVCSFAQLVGYGLGFITGFFTDPKQL